MVLLNDQWGFINAQGEEIIAPQYDDARDFSNGFAAVCREDLWGFVDTNGNNIIPLQYDDVDDFTEQGFAIGLIDDTPYVLFKNGESMTLDDFKTANENMSELFQTE